MWKALTEFMRFEAETEYHLEQEKNDERNTRDTQAQYRINKLMSDLEQLKLLV